MTMSANTSPAKSISKAARPAIGTAPQGDLTQSQAIKGATYDSDDDEIDKDTPPINLEDDEQQEEDNGDGPAQEDIFGGLRPTSRLPPSSRFPLRRDPSPSRRQTLEPGNGDIILSTGERLTGRIRSGEELVTAVNEDADGWFDTLLGCVEFQSRLRTVNANLGKDVSASGSKVESLSQVLKTTHEQLASEQQTNAKYRDRISEATIEVERLRERRDFYRNAAKGYKKEKEQLEKRITQLRSQAAHQSYEEYAISHDSDNEGDDIIDDVRSRRRQGNTREIGNCAQQDKSPVNTRETPAGLSNLSDAEQTYNPKFPDVPNFYGDPEKDEEDWYQWQDHLHAKFQQSWKMFLLETDKIRYIRIHCKGTAYGIVKTRAAEFAKEPYLDHKEALADLNAMFGDYDPMAKAETKLHDPKFPMGVSNKDETFDEFYARWSAVIAELDLTERQKISSLTRLVNTRLQYKINDGTEYPNLRELVRRCRKCDLDTRNLYASNAARGNRGSGSGGGNTNTGKGRAQSTAGTIMGRPNDRKQDGSNSKNTTTSSSSSSGLSTKRFTYPAHIVNKIRQQNRCLRCLRPGHRFDDPKAPCKNDPPVSNEEASLRLAKMGIEWTYENPETHDHDHNHEHDDGEAEK